MTKRLSPEEKKERRPAQRACTFCHSKHLQCSNTRPCQNCTKRGIAHECKDATRKRVKYLSPSATEEPVTTLKKDISLLDEFQVKEGEFRMKDDLRMKDDRSSYTPSLSPYAKTIDQTRVSLGNLQDQTRVSLGSLQDNRDSPSSLSSATTNFNSNFLNQEYMMLGDLISKPSSPSSLDFAQPQPLHPMVPQNLLSELETNDNDTRPFISLGIGEASDSPRTGFNFDLSDNENQYVSPLVSHHIYQTVQDIYSNKIINFDYPSSYHSLTHFLKLRFSVVNKQVSAEEKTRKTSNLLKILKLIASYRPTFISAHKSLFRPFDFQFLEMSFQRCLLDYENLCRLNSSPTIIWRRTGEIVSMSKDLTNLLGLNISDILSKRTFIMELMHDDESIVEYFRLFKSVAVGNLHSRIVTKCKLIKKPSGNNVSTNTKLGDAAFIEFCSVWTVKRDLFDLPMMVVGQFLPVL